MKLIVTADLHLRGDTPRCRKDANNWMEVQKETLVCIAHQSEKNKCPIAIVGDIFDRPTVSTAVLYMFLEFAVNAKYGVYVSAGNHDLKYHSTRNLNASSYGIVHLLSKIKSNILSLEAIGLCANYGEELTGFNSGLYFIHELTFPDKESMPSMIDAKTAQEQLNSYPEASWIFTGDYHRSFIYGEGYRHVVNPGCTTRQKADFKEYKPSVYFVDTDNDDIEQIFLPDTYDVVTDSYLRKEEERETRISSFVESIAKSDSVSLDFVDNVKKAIEKNKSIKESTKKTIITLLEGAKS